MKTLSLLGLASLTSLLAACGAADAETSGTSTDDVTAVTITPPSDVRSVQSAFNFQDGPSDPAALRAGDCYKALVAPVEGIPNFRVKEFANGAVMFPNPYPAAVGKPGPLCVDVHYGDVKMSFNGVSLDAIARWGLGRYAGTTYRAAEDEVDVRFANGAMRIFRNSIVSPENGRYRWATLDPATMTLITAAPSIAGSLLDIRLDAVKVELPLSGSTDTRSVTADAPTVLLAYQYAWARTPSPHSYAMNDDVIGIFERSARVAGDAGGKMTQFHFSKSEIRKNEYEDAATHSEGIDVFDRGPIVVGATPRVTCERDVPADHAPPPYACSGVFE